ncbi:Ral GTPase-activating subunit alpha [Brachionus plicatilis]|uniref:Ral GTPase-activating subunit alpha n=1 Tax=Brachionus plicatilis TaxID=10195 RepID=A0A3M7SJR1_BRAPC|nr:Ral GTPase-activating subunit alpha [Brachionus plicatilis]
MIFTRKNKQKKIRKPLDSPYTKLIKVLIGLDGKGTSLLINLENCPKFSSVLGLNNLGLLNNSVSLINNDLSQQSQTVKQPHERLQDDKKQVQLNCKEEIIKWLIDVLLIDSTGVNAAPNVEMDASLYSSLQSEFKSQDEFSCDESLDSQFTSLNSIPSSSVINPTQSAFNNKHLIQRVLLSNQANINLVHEILRNVYFLNFDEGSNTVRLVLDAYKKWFLNEAKQPAFMLEPAKSEESDCVEQENQAPVFSLNNSSDRNEGENDESEPMLSHRSGSISSSVKNENRIGSVKCLQIFFYHSSNLLLNRTKFLFSEKYLRDKRLIIYLRKNFGRKKNEKIDENEENGIVQQSMLQFIAFILKGRISGFVKLNTE